LPVDPVPLVPVLAVPLLAVPLLAVPLLAVPPPSAPPPSVPVFVDPVAGPPEFVSVGPPEFVSVGLVLALPVPGELDVGKAGVEEPLPGVDKDAGALGLAVLDGLAGDGGQEGVAVALAVALADALPLPLVLAFAEAFEVAVLIVVAVAVPVAGAVAVVVSPGLVLPPPGPSLVPLSVALSDGLLTELAGVPLGVTEVVGLAGLAGADDAELDAHAIAAALPWAAEVPLPAPPAAEPTGVPAPFVL
jgi:hypothetical protein